MKTKFLFSVTSFFLIISALGQEPGLELTFTAVDNAAYLQLDSIRVMNSTQGGDTVLYWPDTVLAIYNVGVNEVSGSENDFQVFQNYPNPVTCQTSVSLYVPEMDIVRILLTDLTGRVILTYGKVLNRGTHNFRLTSGNANLYFFTAQWRNKGSSIKILQPSSDSHMQSSLEYLGGDASSPQFKATDAVRSFLFSLGDELLCICYSDGLQSGMLDTPDESKTCTLQFATNIPCPATLTVDYEGQIYNTIQIFGQCWLKENLNVGTMIAGDQEMTDNSIMEKYCYNNEPDSCTKYGGLYQWREMMQYTTQQGESGICPPGWHLPSDEEWKVLEGAVDSQFGIGDPEWDKLWGWRGYDAGTNLKITTGWNNNGNGTDLFGFSGLPAGIRSYLGPFTDIGNYGVCWTSTENYYNIAWDRYLYYSNPEVYRYHFIKEIGFSVRCLKDD